MCVLFVPSIFVRLALLVTVVLVQVRHVGHVSAVVFDQRGLDDLQSRNLGLYLLNCCQ